MVSPVLHRKGLWGGCLTHGLGFLLCDVEEWRVKLGQVSVHEVTTCWVEAAKLLRAGMMVRIHCEPVLGDLAPTTPSS